MQYPELIVVLTKFLGYDPQPGIVEAQIADFDGNVLNITDKVPMFSYTYPKSYPTTGRLRCQILEEKFDADLGRLLLISSEMPDHISDSKGEYLLIWVLAEQVIEVSPPSRTNQEEVKT